MKLKGVIFDLDGTILNTLRDLSDSMNEALSQYGLPTHEENAYRFMVGNGFGKLIERAVDASVIRLNAQNAVGQMGASAEETDVLPSGRMTELERAELERGVFQAFTEAYSRRYTRSTVPYPGIQPMLAHITDAGVRLGVNSNKREDYTRDLIVRNFPDIEWVDVIGAREDLPKKPDPAAAHLIAEKMGIRKDNTPKDGIFGKISGLFRKKAEEPRESVSLEDEMRQGTAGSGREHLAYPGIAYVGDSNVDIETAKNAGMIAVGVAWGFRGKQELIDAGADFIADDPQKLEEFLLGSRF